MSPPKAIHSAYLEAVVSTFKNKKNIESCSLHWYFSYLNDSEPVVRKTLYMKPSTQTQTQTHRDMPKNKIVLWNNTYFHIL